MSARVLSSLTHYPSVFIDKAAEAVIDTKTTIHQAYLGLVKDLRGTIYIGTDFYNLTGVYRLAQKTAEVAIKVIKLFPEFAHALPLGAADSFLKDSKRFLYFFATFPTLQFYIRGKNGEEAKVKKADWVTQLFNLSGVALAAIGIIDILERFQFDFQPMHNFFKKVPGIGVLPYAGILNLSLVTMTSIIFFQTRQKRQKLLLKEEKLNKQIDFDVAGFKQFITEKCEKYENSSVKVDKKAKWNRFAQLDQSALDNYFKLRKDFLIKKLDKVKVEKKSASLTMVSTAAKVTAVAFSTFVVLSGVGASLLVSATVTLGVVEVACEIKNFFTKKTVKSISLPDSPNPVNDPILPANPDLIIP